LPVKETPYFSLETKIFIRDEVEKVRRDKFEIIKNISRITDEDKLEKNLSDITQNNS
jgi:hypothetical protein